MDSSTISLKASNGLFVGWSADPFPGAKIGVIQAIKPSADSSCMFTVQVVAPGKIKLIADNGYYLSMFGGNPATIGAAPLSDTLDDVVDNCVFSYESVPGSSSVVLKAVNGLYIYPATFGGIENSLLAAKKDIDPSCYFQLTGSIPDSNVEGATFKLPPSTKFGVTGLVNSSAVQEIDIFIGNDPKPHTMTGKPGTQDGQMGTMILESDPTGVVRLAVRANGGQSKLISRQVDVDQKIFFGLLGSEDGADNDYNDCIAILNWPLG